MGEQAINRLRLATGLVMFAYVCAHLANLSLGILSLRAMEDALVVATVFWGAWPLQALLLGSLLIHVGLALRALWRRRTLRLPPIEAAQMVLGFLVPFMLALHVARTRIAETAFGARIDYAWELLQFWRLDRPGGAEQVLLLLVAWSHACIGLRFNLKLRAWYPKARSFLLLAAWTLPLLGLLGFVRAGAEVMMLARDPRWIARATEATRLTAADRATLVAIADGLRLLVLALIGGLLLARFIRRRIVARAGLVTLRYSGGRTVRVTRGTSVLEASRDAAVPHVAICGGRGRCSTCRTRIACDPALLPEAAEAERAALERMRLPANVRLACQLRPDRDLVVTPLLRADDARRAMLRQLPLGFEREIAVLFCDLRGFTALSERRLPYDVVFLLNAYLKEMAHAVEAAGGQVDKFLGDGVMALFGIETDPRTAACQALAAALMMGRRLTGLSATFAQELDRPLSLGIGLHLGTAVLGEIGGSGATPLTAIGDCVNTASRLEGMTKELGVELLVSAELERRSGLDLAAWPLRSLPVRGRSDPIAARAIPRCEDLADLFDQSEAAASAMA